ncbi:hypothetical protein QFC24_000808 [Naganishia onofrii]|uniref:Uncharacterized protein n=1 Tax=Naganishia onofrii TaxID=1851511 RepID=A0ACC2XUT9_9TREE|nr:hypothetical protein QFC24_000808 [Naganishia onofrii]
MELEAPRAVESQRPLAEEQQRKPEIWWSNGIFFTESLSHGWQAWGFKEVQNGGFCDIDYIIDSPIHDPYSATKGLWFAHCGWIFFKPKYSRMKLIERDDLESDPGQ